MPKCSRCNGQGRESYDEDNRVVTDVCYHCAGSGEVEPEVALQDHLLKVAYALAYQEETKYRKARDNDPEGEGYEFCAAENMLSVNDYFQDRVGERQYKLLTQIQQLDSSIQNALFEWYEKRLSERPTGPVPSPNGSKTGYVAVPSHVIIGAEEIRAHQEVNLLEEISEDDIPF
jgi:hypothetical protein